MSQVIDKHLAKAIVDIAIFFEFSDENVLDADDSVNALEQLAAELQLMSDLFKSELINEFNDLAKEYGEKSEFVRNLGDTLGL